MKTQIVNGTISTELLERMNGLMKQALSPNPEEQKQAMAGIANLSKEDMQAIIEALKAMKLKTSELNFKIHVKDMAYSASNTGAEHTLNLKELKRLKEFAKKLGILPTEGDYLPDVSSTKRGHGFLSVNPDDWAQQLQAFAKQLGILPEGYVKIAKGG